MGWCPYPKDKKQKDIGEKIKGLQLPPYEVTLFCCSLFKTWYSLQRDIMKPLKDPWMEALAGSD